MFVWHVYGSIDGERAFQAKIAQNLTQIGFHIIAGAAVECRAEFDCNLEGFARAQLRQDASTEAIPHYRRQASCIADGRVDWHLRARLRPWLRWFPRTTWLRSSRLRLGLWAGSAGL